ncbi:MAG: hypothetical protein Q8928_08400 [Bacteroidota bacterium]|nr:hypothetical protein [Bacteroidota bacterium]
MKKILLVCAILMAIGTKSFAYNSYVVSHNQMGYWTENVSTYGCSYVVINMGCCGPGFVSVKGHFTTLPGEINERIDYVDRTVGNYFFWNYEMYTVEVNVALSSGGYTNEVILNWD